MTMFKAKTIGLLLLLTFASMVVEMPAEKVTNEPDPLCQMLFDTYIARQGKDNASIIRAASHIVAERGRNFGFWKVVLRELQRGREQSEVGCIRVLGEMLAIDAATRDYVRREKETGQTGALIDGVCLGPEVVKELIARGSAKDQTRVGHYAVALLRARVPEATNFFRMILRDGPDRHYSAHDKFYAAVGLAQLGEADGFAWLIMHSEEASLPMISDAWPGRVSDLNHSVAALRNLSGEKNLKSKQEWESWWNKVDKKTLPKSPVITDHP